MTCDNDFCDCNIEAENTRALERLHAQAINDLTRLEAKYKELKEKYEKSERLVAHYCRWTNELLNASQWARVWKEIAKKYRFWKKTHQCLRQLPPSQPFIDPDLIGGCDCETCEGPTY